LLQQEQISCAVKMQKEDFFKNTFHFEQNSREVKKEQLLA
jgi:hypothetical protein